MACESKNDSSSRCVDDVQTNLSAYAGRYHHIELQDQWIQRDDGRKDQAFVQTIITLRSAEGIMSGTYEKNIASPDGNYSSRSDDIADIRVDRGKFSGLVVLDKKPLRLEGRFVFLKDPAAGPPVQGGLLIGNVFYERERN